MADTVKITATLASFDKEVGEAGKPYVLGLPGNKRLTFEDFTFWEGEKAKIADEIFEITMGNSDAGLDEFAKKWLSPADYRTWTEQGLSFRQKTLILRDASKHVLKGMSAGESDASASS